MNFTTDGAHKGLTTTRFSALPEATIAQAVIGSSEAQEPAGWAEVHPEERRFASTRPGRRRSEFVAGRRALRAALREVGWQGEMAFLPGPQGRPPVPSGFTASLTHKDGQALAIAARAVAGKTLGIDCEVVGDRERSSIARKVLRADEMRRWQAAGSQWRALLELFSTKEAIYKALHPHVPRYIGFEEAEILADGEICMHLAGGEGPFKLSRHLSWHGERLLAVVEVHPLVTLSAAGDCF